MGKKTRKTRWRTLPIGDEQSDSEESNTTLDTRLPPTYHQKYYSRLTYSSHSTPTRRYQSDGTKSTRSSSTASENKITFNEDEYTRITTPRQDVLFKKGYLNKPKTYSTQTSTGNSTNSTGNSTGNGTPDYQSTDLEYESQFVFPNGFLDQNGIYYINGYDPYPLMVYNATPYYGSETCNRTKKHSTESLADSASTSNEENSQDAVNQDNGEHGNEVQHPPPPRTNGLPHHPHNVPPTVEYGQVYNMVYPGFYYNGVCPPQDLVNGQGHQSEPQKTKRRRRRKLSQSQTDDQNHNGETSEYTDDDSSSAEEEKPAEEVSMEPNQIQVESRLNSSANENDESKPEEITKNGNATPPTGEIDCDVNNSDLNNQNACTDTAKNPTSDSDSGTAERRVKYDLKPDAEEFVPRSMRPENVHYYKIPPNFVPVPMMSPMPGQNYGHAYFPHGIPLNFIQQNPPMYQGYVPSYGFNPQVPKVSIEETRDVEPTHDIDIRTVVSKLEEVANEVPTTEVVPEKKEKQHHNSSPYKRQKPFEERRKFYPRNNLQNGHYQKRFHNKYSNETPKKDEESQETHNNLKECPRMNEETTELHKEKESTEDNEHQREERLKAAQTQTSPVIEKNELIQKTIEIEKEVEKSIPQPKNQSDISRNVWNSDIRSKWPKRDEKNTQRRDSEERSKQIDIKLNRKFHPNSPARKFGANYNEVAKNSDNVKKPPIVRENLTKPTKPVKPEVINTPINKTQWIPVSSKKKRRNRNVEEVDDEPPEIFEQNEFLQSIIVKASEVTPEIPKEESPNSPVKILEVRDLEKELLSNVGIEIKEEVVPPPNETVDQIKQPKSSTKKKAKKGVQKQPKRVLITDMDFSEPVQEVKQEVIEEKLEPPSNPQEVVSQLKVEILETVEAKVEATPEISEKKNKKKKKKQPKTVDVVSQDVISVNGSEDTYDFLLENTTLVDNSDDKTNMEISQELDLIIQRGMYSSLEEKIKSLNIIPVEEEFFQTVVRTTREQSTDKSPEFTKLLANSMPKFKYCMASVEDDSTGISTDEPSTSKNGLFLENDEVKEILKDIYGKEGSPEIDVLKISTPKEISVEKETLSPPIDSQDKEKLYPITEAVKNWMSKTRENTPEVEILKSPSVIFKEFHDEGSVNGKRASIISESDEEITVYSASRNNSDGVDLLECWENDIPDSYDAKSTTKSVGEKDLKMDDNEEVLEVYESKFGQNEDFLELQKEIEERKKVDSEARSRNFPKHGALPYRAICCNLM